MDGAPLTPSTAPDARPAGRAITTTARGSRDERMTAGLRLAIAVSGLLVSCIAPDENPARRPLVFAVLGAFVLYSAITELQVLRQHRRISVPFAPWADLGWTTLLIGVSDGTSSIFYPLYIFVILCAAFQGGFRAAGWLILASVTSFTIIGGIAAPRGASFELDRTLIRAVYLLLMGYLIAYWGEHEVRQRARLELLRDVSTLSNPRFGIDRTMGKLLGTLRAFFGADTCRLVVTNPSSGDAWTRVATRANPNGDGTTPLPPGLAAVFDVPDSALLHRVPRARRPGGPLESGVSRASDRASQPGEVSARIARELDAGSFISVPFRHGSDSVARIFVTSRQPRRFDASDLDFLAQVLEQVVPVLQNIRLVDQLASDAADEERRRIGRDLHDSVIQPYIGLRMGLAAARQSVAHGEREDGVRVLDRLSVLAEDEIETLRGYVHRLKDGRPVERGDVLVDSVSRFCARFESATGIGMNVIADTLAPLNDRLAAEAFQMVAEALSNVRRHTDARSARVRLSCAEARLFIDVENDGTSAGGAPFSPRSLRDRAVSLGGTIAVQTGAGTAVHIEIPL